MPNLRPWVCQKSAILGLARFQDAIWKCFKCQKKRDTPLFCFHFLFSCSSFPLVSFTVSTFPPWSSLLSTGSHLFPGKALLWAEQLHLLTTYFCFLLWRYDLSFHCASGPHPAFSLPSCLAMILSTPCPLCQLCTWIYHTLSGQGHWSHGQGWAFHILGSTYLWSLYRSFIHGATSVY